ncbi:hypothetical protein CDV31_003088 [Fusarium ambrosium]|uniref:Uncharacterized protein n=1 Tax=Fusarium ambrosium TaxID=131363 RepID=A0A428UV82_9HYPO|nr:hypothetical protein CDV31_003088 [Fusarium ambrosium]
MDGNLAMAEKLLEVGARVNVCNHRGETPLICGLRQAKTEEDVSRMTILSIGYPDFNYNKEHISNTYPGWPRFWPDTPDLN